MRAADAPYVPQFQRALEPVAGLGVPALGNGYLSEMDEPVGGPGTAASQAGSLVEPRTHVENILASLSHRRPPSTWVAVQAQVRLEVPPEDQSAEVLQLPAAPSQPEAWPQVQLQDRPQPQAPSAGAALRPAAARGGRGSGFGSRAPSRSPCRPIGHPSDARRWRHPVYRDTQQRHSAPFPRRPPPQPEHWPRSLPRRLLLPGLLVLLERVPKVSHCSRAPPPLRPLGRSPVSPAHRLARVPRGQRPPPPMVRCG